MVSMRERSTLLVGILAFTLMGVLQAGYDEDLHVRVPPPVCPNELEEECKMLYLSDRFPFAVLGFALAGALLSSLIGGSVFSREREVHKRERRAGLSSVCYIAAKLIVHFAMMAFVTMPATLIYYTVTTSSLSFWLIASIFLLFYSITSLFGVLASLYAQITPAAVIGICAAVAFHGASGIDFDRKTVTDVQAISISDMLTAVSPSRWLVHVVYSLELASVTRHSCPAIASLDTGKGCDMAYTMYADGRKAWNMSDSAETGLMMMMWMLFALLILIVVSGATVLKVKKSAK
mmetsp:Transcript_29223/g.75248  ORF Transcript_29223/g.75248 Transcript_29223/m.75248 type:complete len:291 (-) Transcript_29223:631-1503(-)